MMRIFIKLFVIHLLLFLLLTIRQAPEKRVMSQQRIDVHTVLLQEAPPQKVIKQVASKAKPKPQVKKKVVAVKKTKKNRKKVAALMQKSLQSSGASKKSAPVASKAVASEQEYSFEKVLVLYLKEQLEMPNLGTICLNLTLLADGTFVDFTVSSCDNEKNRSYLEGALQALIYPEFSTYFPKQKRKSFALTFEID